MKKIFALCMVLMFLLTGCAEAPAGSRNRQFAADSAQNSTADESKSVQTAGNAEMFTNRDLDPGYDEAQSVHIQLNGDSISCDSKAVQVNGTVATVTGEGTYVLSGELQDGMIVVDAGKKAKLQLVLNGVDITSKTSAALYILEADKVFVTLAPGSENTLSNGGSFEAIDSNNIDGAVFSKEDLTFNGSGSLTVTSPAGHGIVCKDDLVFTGGKYTLNSAAHGLQANDSVRIADAEMNIQAGKDGVHAENDDDESLGFVYIESGEVTVSAEGDGISAGSTMEISGGAFDIVTGGGSVNGEKLTSDYWGGFMGRGGKGGMGGFMGGNGSDMGGGRGKGGGPGSAGGSDTAGAPDGMGDPPDGMGDPGSMDGFGSVDGFDSAGTSDTTGDSQSIKGIKAQGDLTITGGVFTIDSADDAVHSNSNLIVSGGSFTISTGDDGFHADESLTVTGGTILITESYEGLEGLHVTVSGGDITLTAKDDGINAAGGTDESGFGGFRDDGGFGGRGRGGMGGGSSNGSIVLSGGTIYVNASGDGIDANGTLEITGGHITVAGPIQGDTATLDYDVSGTISGGTFIGTGASGMAQTFSDSEQGVISVSVGNQAAGTKVALKDFAGKVILETAPELDFAVVILSSPELTKGGTYTLEVGSNSGEVTAQ